MRGACLSTLVLVACTSSNATDIGHTGLTTDGAAGTSGAAGSGGSAGGVACTESAPLVIAANQQYPDAIGIDTERIYWVVARAPGVPIEVSTGAVMTLPKGQCGATPEVFATSDNVGTALALSADRVYWSAQDGIWSKAKSGGQATLVSASYALALFVDGTDVFFTGTEYDQASGKFNGSVAVVDSTTGTLSVLLSEQASALPSIAANADRVFFSEDGRVRSVPRAGGAPTDIAVAELIPGGIALDASHVYWVDGGNHGVDIWTGGGSIMSAPLAGGPPLVLAGDLVGPRSIAIDSEFAYAAGRAIETEQTPLVRAPLGGGQAITLVQSLEGGDPSDHLLAVDDTHIYYLTRDAVMRVGKSYTP